jgi:NAD(P)-dependent dehydrogenase (short-subunit alcohol dehydrogenase family)
MKSKSYKRLFDLKGKAAIVTGAVGILGRRFCAGLAEYGANIAAIDLAVKKPKDLARQIIDLYGGKAIGVECDITSPESVSSMVEQVVAEFGEINILHNNAQSHFLDAASISIPFEDYPLDEWRHTMAVNVDGYFLVAQKVGRQMLKQGKGGSIIQTASIYGIMAPDQRIYDGSLYKGLQIGSPADYTVSKAAVIGLTKYLATYWAEKGIRVNTLSPGGVESGQDEQFKRKYSSRVPMRRMAQQDEMVGALIYLASDASSYVTGQNIIVDGGLDTW